MPGGSSRTQHPSPPPHPPPTHILGPLSEENSQWKMTITLLLASKGTMGFFSRNSSISCSIGRLMAPWGGRRGSFHPHCCLLFHPGWGCQYAAPSLPPPPPSITPSTGAPSPFLLPVGAQHLWGGCSTTQVRGGGGSAPLKFDGFETPPPHRTLQAPAPRGTVGVLTLMWPPSYS